MDAKLVHESRRNNKTQGLALAMFAATGLGSTALVRRLR